MSTSRARLASTCTREQARTVVRRAHLCGVGSGEPDWREGRRANSKHNGGSSGMEGKQRSRHALQKTGKVRSIKQHRDVGEGRGRVEGSEGGGGARKACTGLAHPRAPHAAQHPSAVAPLPPRQLLRHPRDAGSVHEHSSDVPREGREKSKGKRGATSTGAPRPRAGTRTACVERRQRRRPRRSPRGRRGVEEGGG